jgi:hypothetical protein
LRFLAYADGWRGDVIEWVPACDWCQVRIAERQAQVERLEALWSARECAAPDCSVVFTPRTTTQRFHDDRCRKRTHGRLKARLAG